jgi:hypothetical protein
MTEAIAIATVLTTILTPVAEGKATRYNPGIMDRVVANRVRWHHIDLAKPHAGYIALADPDLLGEQAWIQWPDGRLTGPYLVADCGQQAHQDHLKRIGFAVDLSWELAVKFGVIDKPLPGVRIYIQREAIESRVGAAAGGRKDTP